MVVLNIRLRERHVNKIACLGIFKKILDIKLIILYETQQFGFFQRIFKLGAVYIVLRIRVIVESEYKTAFLGCKFLV